MKRLVSILALAAILIMPGWAQDLSALYEAASPSVVVLMTKETVIAPNNRSMTMSAQGLGSGVLIDGGRILTAAHVVQTADLVLVQFKDGQEIFAKVTASSPQTDVALLQLEEMPKNPVVAKVGDSDRVKVGEQVFVIGAPFGLSYTLSSGYISGRITPNTIANDFSSMEFFQTDAAINQGNSGGPMFNMNGEVIGVVSHILSMSGGFEGLGFAATTNRAFEILQQQARWSGMQAYGLEGELAAIFNIPEGKGILVQQVAEDSPAARFGLRPGYIPVEIMGESFMVGGDIIVEIAGISVSAPDYEDRIQQSFRRLKAGETFKLTVLRGGYRVELEGSMD